jgi:biopolymer transport protein ExbB
MNKWFVLLCLVLFCCRPAAAQDMRLDYEQMREKKEAALRQAEASARQAQMEAEESRRKILSDKTALTRAVAELEQKNSALKQQAAEAEKQFERLAADTQGLEKELADLSGVVREIAGLVRSNARDMEEMYRHSPQGVLTDDRQARMTELAAADRLPSMAVIRDMVDLALVEIDGSGQVRRVTGTVIDRGGQESPADILMIGNLTAAYRTKGETGFALYSDASRRLFALSEKPSFLMAWSIRRYLAGRSDAVWMDISGGAALRQMTHKLSLMAQIPKGGPIVWPTVLIFFIGLGIIAERVRYLRRGSCDVETFMTRVSACIRQEDWDACRRLCDGEEKKSVPRVIRTALDYRLMSREDMENVLQEAILNEVPRLERFLSTLGMLATIAPLLGLLGTVTGMINTFHVITYYGTGDPRMMSSGISEALVTTMVGLAVAVPLMLAHTLISRRVEHTIGQMEEKAVAFVNQVFKNRGQGVEDSRGQGIG